MQSQSEGFRQDAFIADLAAARGLIDLKQAALLFDRVNVLSTPEKKADQKYKSCRFPEVSNNELDWLAEKDFLRTVEDPFASYRNQKLCDFLLLREDQQDGLARRLSNLIPRFYAGKVAAENDAQHAIPLVFGPDISGITLTTEQNVEVSAATKDSAYGLATSIILSYIPIPDPQTPWEAIFEFRSDPVNKRAFANLRAYTSKLARSTLSPRELKDEIEADYLNLCSGLDRNRVKYQMKALEVFVVSAASVIENLVKLRFSQFVKPIFELKTTRQDCLEGEAKLAERSLYYVVAAQAKFS